MAASSPQVRDLRFDVERAPSRHWHGGRRSITSFFDALSILFPAGERFFIASVRRHREHVKEPRLTDEVALFCAQEGVHGREHVRYNEMLRAQGYPIEAMEQRVISLLRFVTKTSKPRVRLAVTCALEHFTALLAHLLLADDRLLQGADPTMAALWKWHAAEENEHKAVAYDVYLAAGGNYFERVIVMAVASTIFWAKVVEHQMRLMHVDRTLWSVREWWSLVRFLFVQPGGMLGMVGLYLRYYAPGFHPNDIDAAPLLDAWKREYAESPLYRDAA